MKTCCIRGINGYQYVIPLDKILYLKAESSKNEDEDTRYYIVLPNTEIQIVGADYVELYKQL